MDDDDLRAGLRSLTVAAPPQPPARAAAAMGRARGIRRRRAALAAVAVLLPAVAVGAVLARPAPRPDYSNVATWPDRSDPAFAALRQAAFDDWERSHDLGPDEQPRWLYAGRVPHTDDLVVTFAVCAADTCSRAVVMRGDERTVRLPADDPEASSWMEEETRDLVAGRPMAPLSAYLPAAVPDDPEESPTTVLFVLAAPDAAAVSYSSPAVAGRGGVAGELAPAGGAFTGDVGYLAAHATISVRDDRGRVVHTGRVGDGDAVGNAEHLEFEIVLPRGYDRRSGSTGQVGNTGDGTHDASLGTEPHALFARCLGGAPLRVVMNGVRGEVPCDGRPHRAVRVVRPVTVEFEGEERPTFHYVVAGDDPYTVYEVALAKRS